MWKEKVDNPTAINATVLVCLFGPSLNALLNANWYFLALGVIAGLFWILTDAFTDISIHRRLGIVLPAMLALVIYHLESTSLL